MGHRALRGTQISLELGQGAAEWSLLARAQMNSSKCQWWDVQVTLVGSREIPAGSRPITECPSTGKIFMAFSVLEFDPKPWLVWSLVQSFLGWVFDTD